MGAYKTFSVAVFHELVQFSDMLPVDVLGNISTAYIDEALKEFPDFPGLTTLREQAVDLKVYWVASSLEPTKTTPGISLKIQPTHTYETCPLDVDILLIAGPYLSVRPPASLEYMRKFVAAKKGTLMTTCTGALWAAHAGVLDGRKVTTNRGGFQAGKQFYPKAEWHDRRWVVDEKPGEVALWTSGGAFAGADMMAAYVRKSFQKEIVEFALGALDLNNAGKGEEY